MCNLSKEIANTIILNLDNSHQLGLKHGKMGVCCFLFAYSNLYESKPHYNTACNMLREIIVTLCCNFNKISKDTLCEVGIGLIFLITKNYIEDVKDQGFIQKIDDIVFNSHSSNEDLNLKAQRSELYLAGLYLVFRMRTSIKPLNSDLIKNYITKVCQQLNTCKVINVTNNSFTFWISVSYVLSKVLEENFILAELKDIDLAIKKIKKEIKSEKSLFILTHENVLLFNEFIIHKSIEKGKILAAIKHIDNYWNYILLDSCSFNNGLNEFYNQAYIKREIKNMFYSIMEINSKLAGIGLLLLKNTGNKNSN